MFRWLLERFLLGLLRMHLEWNVVEWVVEEEEADLDLGQAVNLTGHVVILTVEIRILVGARNATGVRHQEMGHLIPTKMGKMKGNSLECEEDFVVAQEAGREEAVEETAQAQVTETIRALVATQAEEDFVAA